MSLSSKPHYEGPIKTKPFLAWVKEQPEGSVFDWTRPCSCAAHEYLKSLGHGSIISVIYYSVREHSMLLEDYNFPPELRRVFEKFHEKFLSTLGGEGDDCYIITYERLAKEIEAELKGT